MVSTWNGGISDATTSPSLVVVVVVIVVVIVVVVVVYLLLLFLDASSHLYRRVCPSVCPYVRPSVTNYAKPPKTTQNGLKTLWLHTYPLRTHLFARPGLLLAL